MGSILNFDNWRKKLNEQQIELDTDSKDSAPAGVNAKPKWTPKFKNHDQLAAMQKETPEPTGVVLQDWLINMFIRKEAKPFADLFNNRNLGESGTGDKVLYHNGDIKEIKNGYIDNNAKKLIADKVNSGQLIINPGNSTGSTNTLKFISEDNGLSWKLVAAEKSGIGKMAWGFDDNIWGQIDRNQEEIEKDTAKGDKDNRLGFMSNDASNTHNIMPGDIIWIQQISSATYKEYNGYVGVSDKKLSQDPGKQYILVEDKQFRGDTPAQGGITFILSRNNEKVAGGVDTRSMTKVVGS